MKPHEDVNKYCVPLSGCIRDAMAVIDRGGIGLAVVLAEDGRAVGVVSDGDVRRALLSGHDMSAALAGHMTRDFLFVHPANPRADVLDLMRARLVSQIPVLDDAGRLVGIHTLQKVLGASVLPNWAVVMAGGQGVRLRPVTERLPKPMLPVAGRPILERLVLHLVGHGIRRIFLAVNYMADKIVSHFGAGEKFGCSIEYLRESEPMGSGGALSLLPAPPEHPVLALNGDLVTQVNVAEMIRWHDENPCYATMGVKAYHHKIEYGCVETDPDGRIRSVEEKPSLSKLINAGIYVLSPAAVGDVPRRFFPITDLFVGALQRSLPCGSYLIDGDWIDVGRHEHLHEARTGRPPGEDRS